MDNVATFPQSAASAPAEPPIPADRITELYRGEIFTEETARAARDRIHWMCAQCRGDAVLDVGCSQGIASILLAREGFAVTAIDTHPASIAFARAEIARETATVRGRLTLLETDLASLPAERAFDTILLGEVIEHQALPLRLLRDAKARLRPGGVLVITTPFALHPHPDHKVSLFPRDLSEFAAQLGMALRVLESDGDYMRAVFALDDSDALELDAAHLLRITESATLSSQGRLFDQLANRSEQLKKKTDALKLAQKKLAESTEAAEVLESQVRDRVGELKSLRVAQAQAADKLREEHAKEIRNARAAVELARKEETRVRAELQREIDALRNQGGEQLRQVRAAMDRQARELTQLREAARSAAQSRALQAAAERRARDAESRLEAAQAEARAAHLTHLGERAHLKERNDRFKERLAAAKASMAATKGTTSYRLGRMLVRGLKTPRAAAALPGQLWGLWREVQARRKARAALLSGLGDASLLDGDLSMPVASAKTPPRATTTVLADTSARNVGAAPRAKVPAGAIAPASRRLAGEASTSPRGVAAKLPLPDTLELDALRARLESDGLDSVRGSLLAMRSRVDAKLLATRALQLGKSVHESAGPEVDFELAKLAVGLDRSDQTWRGYFWAAQRTRHFEQACMAIREIEKLYGPEPAAAQQAVLDKLRISPAYQLSALELLVDRPTTPIVPVRGRVAYVLHNSLPYSSGGYGTRSHGVATGLKTAGHEVVVLTRPGFPLDIKAELGEGEVPAVDTIDDIPYVRTLEPRRKGLSMLRYVIESADALEHRLREWRPEMVVSASNHVTGLPALIAARRVGVPFIYEVRGLWEITRISREQEFEDTPAFAVQSLLEAKVSQLADHVCTLTEPMREELIQRGVPRERIELLPNSCDPQRFLPRPRDEELGRRLGIPADVPVIGYVGTFVDYEGLEDLTLACTLLKKRSIPFRLLLVGNENASGTDRGPITEQIVRIAESEGMSDWLIMPGRVPHEEVESYYSLIDVAPFPRKPWPVCEMVSPMKPLEALAMEKPVLVSSVRALTEMIADGRTGRVFEKGNIASLADKLAEMLADPTGRQALGRQGREWVCAERTWNQVGEVLARRIGQIVAGRAGTQAAVSA